MRHHNVVAKVDEVITAPNQRQEINRGQEYTISDEGPCLIIGEEVKKGEVMLFSTYWVPVPAKWFTKERRKP